MLHIGIIGAGSISEIHITQYLANPNCEIRAIADLNLDQAKKRAAEYQIKNVYSDYHEILNDSSIDAVSIVTPTFTHKDIVVEALKCGKHVLCEKPPALNAEQVMECKAAAEQAQKCLMFGFVCRFMDEIQYLKAYVDSGKIGKIISAEAARLCRCENPQGWFMNKSKAGGGPLIDGAIHELDAALYLMGYPKPTAVMGFTSDLNRDLPSKMVNNHVGWVSADKNKYDCDVENVASGYITFENGSYLFIKTSSILCTVSDGRHIELSGEKAGIRYTINSQGRELRLLEYADGYFRDVKPVIEKKDFFNEEINHFVDCCLNGTPCICKLDEAVTLMRIITAIYQSAETGKPVIL